MARTLNRTDLLDKAGRLVAKGELDGAVELYLKLFQNDRSDWSIGNTLGDLYVRLGRSNEATAHFLSLAEQLSSDGFAAKSRALYRKILRIQPDHRLARERLDDLERPEAGSVSPFLKRVLETARAARETTPEVAEPTPEPAPPPQLHAPVGMPEVTAPPRRPVPTGSPIVQPALDVPARPGAPQAAGIPASSTEWADEWAAVLSQTPAAPPADPAAAPRTPATPIANITLAQAAELDVNDFDQIIAAAEARASQHDFKRAAATIEKFLSAQPQHIDALEKLIEVGVDGRLDTVLISAQTRLAEACLDAGQFEQARNVAADLAEREPDVPAHRDLLDRIVQAQTPAPARPQVVPIAPPAAHGFFSDDMSEADAEAEINLSFDQISPDQPLYADEPGATELDVTDVDAEPIADDPVFEEIRSTLLEDAAAGAEERLSEAVRMIEGKKYDEAVPALEDAMCAPHLRAIAGAKLAYVYRVRGLAMEALECLEWVAELPPPTEESGHELAYQLALTLEAVGQEAQALGVYRELLAEVGPGFRDIAQRVERLAAA